MNAQAVRVLVVEDDYLVNEMIKGMLEETGHIVVGEAFDGLEAIEQVKELHPDVVVMDIHMMDMDGLEAARRIADCCPTPVVILTAYENPQLVEAACDAGVAAYLIKPPDMRTLERAISLARARFEDAMELRRLNRELTARNEDLLTFAHTVAHDLKSPLTPMIGFAEMLSEEFESLSQDEIKKALQNIVVSSRKMVSIIDSLLLLAEVREKPVQLQPLEMKTVVNGVLEQLNYLIETYQAELVFPSSWPDVWGYAPWVEAIWVNYITNALKYGGRPPRVELGAEMVSVDLVRFFVQDNGAGLSPEAQAQLFIPFRRLEPRAGPGHGLGLSIVRRIVEKLGGQVGVESEPGKGSRFTFTLSITPPFLS